MLPGMCDTVVVVEPNRVLFAKNSDRDPNESQALEWTPRRSHPEGSLVRCTWIAIPQVRSTHAVLLSRPFWMWGAEMGANEFGVVIGNEAVFTDQPYRRVGLTGMDLVRLALERARTAEQAAHVIAGLLRTHGQGGGCGHEDRSFTYHNSFIVADPRTAFVVETAGDLVAVEPVTSGVRSISNALTIEPFASEHADRLRGRVARAARRQGRTCGVGATVQGVTDLFALLRDHGPGQVGPDWSIINGAMGAPCMHAGGLVASSQTTASWVSELRPTGMQHWVTGTAAPCTGIFKPVAVDRPTQLGPHPDDTFDDLTPWWRHERRHRLLLRNAEELLPAFAARRDALEASWVDEPPDTGEAFRQADEALDSWLAAALAEHGAPDRRPAHVRRYWQVRNERAGLTLPAVVLPATRGPMADDHAT